MACGCLLLLSPWRRCLLLRQHRLHIACTPGSDSRRLSRKWLQITERALGPDAAANHPGALRALDIVLKAWAAECRQIALRHLPYGGLFMAGGLAPKLLVRAREIVPAAFVDDKVSPAPSPQFDRSDTVP